MSRKRKARKRSAQKLKKTQDQIRNPETILQDTAEVSTEEDTPVETPPETELLEVPVVPAEEIISEPEENIPEPEEIISKPEKAISEPEEAIPEPDGIISEPEEIISESEKAIPEPEKAISESEETTSEPDEDEDEETSSPSMISKIGNIILTVILLVMVGCMGYVMLCTMRGGVVSVFGKCVLQVVTGSMEPSIHTGDFIIVEKTDPSALHEGDIITYYSEQSDIFGMLVTHRIKEITADGDFVTMGDANPIADRLAVRPDQIIGRYTRKARFCIMLSTFADLKKLLLLAVMIAVSLVAFYEMRTIMQLSRQVAEERQAHEQEQKEQRIREAIAQEIRRLEAEGLPPELQEGEHDTGKLDETKDGGGDHPV